MHKLLRFTAVFSVLLVLVVAATVVVGNHAKAGTDPCVTVVPTDTAEPGVTETVDAGTITPEPTDTVEVPTDTPTDVPTDTPTEVPTDTPTEVPTDTATPDPTFTPQPPPALVGNQIAGVNQGGSRVLYQAVDCETPEATTAPVTELPNTGTGSDSGSSNIMVLFAILIAAFTVVAVRMRMLAHR